MLDRVLCVATRYIVVVLVVGGLAACSSSTEPLQDAVGPPAQAVVTATAAGGVPRAARITNTPTPAHALAQASVPANANANAALRPATLSGTVTDALTGQPLTNARVQIGDVLSTTTDANGRYRLDAVPDAFRFTATAPDHALVQVDLHDTPSYDVALWPTVLTGTMVDAQTGAPLAQVHVVAMAGPGQPAVASTRTDAHGQYQLANVPQGSTIRALLPGYRRAQTTVQPGTFAIALKLEPFEAKALYLPARLAAQGMSTVNHYFDTIDRTELTAMVLDLKSDHGDDIGMVYYQSAVPDVVAAGTTQDRMPLQELLAEAKRRNIYMIARVQIFAHDNALLAAHPDWYVQHAGQPWRDFAGMAWLDPYDERVWDYNIKLAVEAAQLGFDEIQFDYIRFPSDGNLERAGFKGPYGPEHAEGMYQTIGRVCARAQQAINNAGAFLGVDVFGYTTWEPQPGIGQNLQIMGQHVDYVYPMVYPSHYVYNELGLGNPDEHPFEIVDASMTYVKDQLQGPASRARVRPWLQDFTATWIPGTIVYGPTEVRAQIDATERHRAEGTRGWALWSFTYQYTIEALNPR